MMLTNWVDQRDVPEWGHGPDGRYVKIKGDPVAAQAYEKWRAQECQHSECAIVERKDALNRPIFNRYCTECGLRMSSAISHATVSEVSDHSIEWFENRNANYSSGRRQALETIADEAAARLQALNRADYSEYLNSDPWRRRRAKVLERASGLCEGCMTNAATEVHHTTYQHLGNEFAFELIALCDACHSRIHEENAA